ncbi:hypothetical protein FE275_13230 [Pseudomonas koreensis]|uniref:hypothetical protein n=1 Tax=Pseudomonas koreensis TaxID=198620 RepID=UPI00123B6E0C|nr:hypothetical protein [Pseudomonas koreensis]KAA8740886.1 hypothetical protein FE275_13230 [Pseudomonas koreensis]
MFVEDSSESVEGVMIIDEGESEDQVVNDRPMISFFDGDSETLLHLRKAGFNCTEATLGNLMRVPNTSRDSHHLLQYAHSIPANFHEFDIAIVDLKATVTDSYSEIGKLSLRDVTEDATYALLSEYPQQIFNFKPFGVRALYSQMHEFQSKSSIFIVFADEKVEADYRIVKVSSSGNKVVDVVKCSSLDFYAGFPVSRNKEGARLKENGDGLRLTDLLLKHMVGGRYSVVFEHPRSWNGAVRNYEPSENFKPLAVNEVGEIVAFAHDVEKSLVLVFPQVKNKAEFLCDLLNGHLAEFFPELFPYSGAFGWLDDGSYPLPGELELRDSRVQLDAKYRKDVEDNDQALVALKSEHQFLREMLTESGEKLVCAIEIYLKWLGFDSVVNMDDVVNDVLEEDLQVDCGDKLLVVEVKGIGGTSTDKACSQISKIKFRRAEQRGKFDVFGLYIVNHQRYVSPKNRKNPPFTEHQINDARLDKRGLLTTYDLYRAYFLILGGVLEKEFVREKLFDYGVIDFYPSNMVSVGRSKETLKGGRVVVFDLVDVLLAAGMKLVAKKGDSYSVHQILTIQLDGVEVPCVSSGEVGVMLDTPVPNRAEILLWDESKQQVTQE